MRQTTLWEFGFQFHGGRQMTLHDYKEERE